MRYLIYSIIHRNQLCIPIHPCKSHTYNHSIGFSQNNDYEIYNYTSIDIILLDLFQL